MSFLGAGGPVRTVEGTRGCEAIYFTETRRVLPQCPPGDTLRLVLHGGSRWYTTGPPLWPAVLLYREAPPEAHVRQKKEKLHGELTKHQAQLRWTPDI